MKERSELFQNILARACCQPFSSLCFVIVRIGCDDELDPGKNNPSPMLSLSDLVFLTGFEDFPPDMRSRANEFKMPRVPP